MQLGSSTWVFPLVYIRLSCNFTQNVFCTKGPGCRSESFRMLVVNSRKKPELVPLTIRNHSGWSFFWFQRRKTLLQAAWHSRERRNPSTCRQRRRPCAQCAARTREARCRAPDALVRAQSPVSCAAYRFCNSQQPRSPSCRKVV
jgi:hypothetical protein